MPVPFAQITTIKEVYDYAVGSAKAAMTKCSGVSADYDNLASQIKDYVNQELGGNWNEMAGVAQFKQEILDINADCRKVSGSTPSVPVQPKAAVNQSNTSSTSDTQFIVKKAGFPWWIVLLLGGGALAYYMLSKKDGGPKGGGPKKRTYSKVTRRRKGKARRRYGIRKNR